APSKAYVGAAPPPRWQAQPAQKPKLAPRRGSYTQRTVQTRRSGAPAAMAGAACPKAKARPEGGAPTHSVRSSPVGAAPPPRWQAQPAQKPKLAPRRGCYAQRKVQSRRSGAPAAMAGAACPKAKARTEGGAP